VKTGTVWLVTAITAPKWLFTKQTVICLLSDPEVFTGLKMKQPC
jgi:hypothetical protein